MPNQEPAFTWPFGNGPVRVGTQGLFRLCLKTFVAPFLPAQLTAPGSPRMRFCKYLSLTSEILNLFWLVVLCGKFDSANQKHHLDLGSDTSSERNFCARFSDVTSPGNQWWRREMSTVFSGYPITTVRYSLLRNISSTESNAFAKFVTKIVIENSSELTFGSTFLSEWVQLTLALFWSEMG